MPLYVYTEALAPTQCAEFAGLPEEIEMYKAHIRIKEMPVYLVAVETTSAKKATKKAKDIIDKEISVARRRKWEAISKY
jgi:hypothetical protein